MLHEAPSEQVMFLSTAPAGKFERRAALAFVLVSSVIFLVVAPYATRPLLPVRAFIPAYEAALFSTT
jgi:hypothetical protein